MGEKILLVFGTRPEAIKMAPLVVELKKGADFDVRVCVTGQHREMLDQVLNVFNIVPDYDLNIMAKGQTLTSITSSVLKLLPEILDDFDPNLVLVHGDTSTTFSAALTAFYSGIQVGHVEAGLRTGNINSPWPEEANRKLTTAITKFHFAPTKVSRRNLIAEGVDEADIFVTGNTVIDALLYAKDILHSRPELQRLYEKEYPFMATTKKTILVTGHRRESFGAGFEEICYSLLEISRNHSGVQIVYPVHLNPKVREPVNRILKGADSIHLIEPLEYLPFVYFMEKSALILTDSGGVQEEAPSLGKRVVVMRDTSERPEAIESGAVTLVGANRAAIVKEVGRILESVDEMRIDNPFGNGDASSKIVDAIRSQWI